VKNDLETYVIIHGNEDSVNEGKMAGLAKAVSEQNKQVIILDWSALSKGNIAPNISAGSIHDVAKFAVDKLKNEWKIDSKNLNLIGHSLGSYVASEIGFLLSNKEPDKELDSRYRENPNIDQQQRVNSLIALDPAALFGLNRPSSGLYDLDDAPDSQNPIKFNLVSKFSRAFFGERGLGDGLGSSNYAKSANESIYVDFKKPNGFRDQLSFSDSHANIVYLYTNMLKNPGKIGSLFNLNVGEHTDWKKDTYKDISHGGGDEAILVATAYKDEGSFNYKDFGGNDPNTEPELLFAKDANPQNDDVAYGSKGGDILGGGLLDRNSLFGVGDDATFNGPGNDKLYGDSGDDTIYGGKDNDTLFGDQGDDFLSGDNGNDYLAGGLDDDTLTGVNQDHLLRGFGQIDTLIGGGGVDLFILGTNKGTFYDDDNASTNGVRDYALIVDFGNISGQDIIQLSGTKNRYILGNSPNGLPVGTGIYLDTNRSQQFDPTDELIAIVQQGGVGPTLGRPVTLNLDASYFKYV